jgi:hypothetical protein
MGFRGHNLNTYGTWDNHYVAYKYRVQIVIKIQTLVTQFLQIQVPDMFTFPLTKTLLR